jgi:16S rRNA (guanine527-N7)-methyltransferase
MIDDLRSVLGSDVPRETLDRLNLYAELIRQENERHNLIARSTLGQLWSRHLLDSAQLLRFMPGGARLRADLGSGAGLPGMVLAILSPHHPFTLIEPRRLRAEFLRDTADQLGLGHVEQRKAERAAGRYDLITARAVASIDRLFAAAHHLSHRDTIWVLPKGRTGELELVEAERSWQGRFQLEPSITDGDAVIVIASSVTARAKGRR